MANTPMYDPKTSEARSSWLAGLTEACAKLSNSLNLKTVSVVDLQLNELFISDDDRYRIYQAELGNKLWVSDPAPVIKQNGNIITPENNYFTIDYLGGSIAFEPGHTLDENDTITANVTCITGTSSEIESLNASIQAAQQSSMAFRGYYKTYDNLVADISDPQIGNFAIVGGTDNSVYIWNPTYKKWENTFKETDLSDYYTIDQVDDELEKKEDVIESFGSTTEADNYYYGGRKQWVNVFEKVLGTTLAGLVTTSAESVTDEDDILGAIGKLQAQLDDANKNITESYDELTSSIDEINSTIDELESSIKDKQPVKTTFTVRSDDWSDHAVTVNDDKILADTKYVYVLGLVGASIDVYDGGSIWADDIAFDGEISLHTKPDADIAVDLTFELIRLETSEENTQPYGAKVISKILGGGGSVEGFRPASIRILTPPTTVQYYAGDVFIPDGMTIEIVYDNGAKLETTGYRWQPSGPLEYGTENVTVIFSENGGTVSIEQPITVIREEVEVPYQPYHIVYDGFRHTSNFIYDKEKIIENNFDIVIFPGTYYTTFYLCSPRYEWADTHTTEAREIAWVIDRATITTVPTQNGTLTYNMETQTPNWNNYDQKQLTISGDTEGIEADVYTAQFTPTDNYQWPDGGTEARDATWKIDVYKIQEPMLGIEYPPRTYTGKPWYVSYNIDNNYIAVEGELSGTDAGDYKVKFILINKKSTVWGILGTTNDIERTWTIYKATGTLSATPTIVKLNNDTPSVNITVNTNSDGQITATPKNVSIVKATVTGNTVKIETVGNTSGDTTVTISVAEGTNWTKPSDVSVPVNASFFPAPGKALDQYTPEEISQISKAGLGPSYFAVGDETAEINMNGKVSDGLTLTNFKIRAFIVGFDHNQSVESPREHVTHFQLGKVDGNLVGFVDSGYGTKKTSGQWLNMYNAANNSGGWKGSLMRKNIMGGDTTLTNPQADSLLAALPADWRAVMRQVTKYTDNKGGGSDTAANVTATKEYFCLPAEFEYLGIMEVANSNERNYQQHYTYYASANKRIHYRHDQTGTAVRSWTRSVDASIDTSIVVVYTDGEYYSDDANASYAVAPLLFI